MLQVTKLTIEYRKLLFKDLSFILGNKEKVGLVGLNGSGKTTLFKILAGLETPDSGSIELVNEKIAYLPQEYSFPEGMMVGEFLESLVDNPYKEMYKVNKILNRLGLTDLDIYQDVSSLSYGQKMKVYLTKLLYQQPTILLLDEPTNHLDIYGILWLEEFIQKFEGICIIVSHDREFLNSVVNKIFEIDEQKLSIFDGNYDDYIDEKIYRIEQRRMEFNRQEKKRTKFENMIEIIKKHNPGVEQARALKAARTRFKREVLDTEIDKYKEQRIKNLVLKGKTHRSKLILDIQDLTFGYKNGETLLEHANLSIYGQEKIWFYGPNGIGKSTLIKLITKELTPDSGKISIGENVKWTYFSQDQSHLNMDKTLEEYFLENTDVSYNQSFGILEKFLFDKEMRKVKLGKLSPGQRARISFAVFAQHEYDLIILDEPTNHLDIKSKEVIEQALKNFQGAILLISHDRYFVRSLDMDQVLTIKDKELIFKAN